MSDRIADVHGKRTPHAKGTVWPARIDQYLEDGVGDTEVERWVQSACLLCSNGCGCDIAVRGGRMVGVRGRAGDSISHGRLGPKGLYGSTPWASSPDRLTRPLVRDGGQLVETDWPTAMGRVVAESRRLLKESGPLSHGFYTSPLSIARADVGHRTANELTMTVWDPVSKQPTFKTAVCRVTRLRPGDGPAPAPTTTASAPSGAAANTRTVRHGAGAAPATSTVLAETPHYPLEPAQAGHAAAGA